MICAGVICAEKKKQGAQITPDFAHPFFPNSVDKICQIFWCIYVHQVSLCHSNKGQERRFNSTKFSKAYIPIVWGFQAEPQAIQTIQTSSPGPKLQFGHSCRILGCLRPPAPYKSLVEICQGSQIGGLKPSLQSCLQQSKVIFRGFASPEMVTSENTPYFEGPCPTSR